MILGIDPGKTGAAAWVSSPGPYCARILHRLLDLKGCVDKQRGVLNYLQLRDALEAGGPVELIIVEDVHSRPGDGHVGAFDFGRSCGVIEAAACEVGALIRYAPPQVWKATLGLSRDKAASRLKASILFPGQAHLFKRKSDHDRAEAVLLAVWGERFIRRAPVLPDPTKEELL